MKRTFKIGTRSSPLALWQAKDVAQRLGEAALALGIDADFELVKINSSGDKIQNVALADLGGKGLFAKEIELALLAGTVDLGVHSLKDMETVLPQGLSLAAMTAREDPRDSFISRVASSIQDLPKGAKVGTASARRKAQVLRQRPDLDIDLIRGNVATRLSRIDEGAFDATLLAQAGLLRLGIAGELEAQNISHPIEVQDMLPSVAQGIVAVEVADDFGAKDQDLMAMLGLISCQQAWYCGHMERAVLRALDGSCKSSIAVHCSPIERQEVNTKFDLQAHVYALDGQEFVSRQVSLTEPADTIAAKTGEAKLCDVDDKVAFAMGLTLAEEAQHLLLA